VPWKVFKNGDEWCVYKLKDDGSKGAQVPGGCHSSKDAAEAHQRALYSNESDSQIASEIIAAQLAAAGVDISLVNIPDVPMVEVGIEYPAMTGPVTFTFEQMRDAVIAYQNDDAIVAPRLKLGHINQVYKSGDMPAVGLAQNLRLENDGKTIVGDYVGVPAWLAEVLPYAYPSRSVEASFDVETTTGKKWQLVITDLGLLGVVWPGCMTIDDLPTLYGTEIPDNVEIAAEIRSAMEGGKVSVAAAVRSIKDKVMGQVNISDVERAFYNEWAVDTRYWWYICAELVDPMELIVEDDDQQLHRLPVEISGKEITFGEPSPVNIEFVDASARVQGVIAEYGGRVAAAYKTREASGAHVNDREGGAAVDAATLRKTLNLSDDTPDEEVLRVANERLSAGPEPTGEGGEGAEPETPAADSGETSDGDGDTSEGEGQPEAEAQTAASSVVTIDKGTLAQLQRDAELGRKAHERQESDEDDRILTEAMGKGKFPPARKEHWAQLMKLDREGTIAQLKTLAENVIPINQRALQEADDGEATDMAAGFRGHFPEIAQARAEAESDKRPLVQMEV
jgi:hypothetical protein